MLREIILQYKKITGLVSAPFIINRYLKQTLAGQRKIILGGHWSNHPGWLVHQDITKKLKLPARNLNVVFLEHVFEHVKFDQAVFFLRKRVLQKNGIIRIVSPFSDKLITADFEIKR